MTDQHIVKSFDRDLEKLDQKLEDMGRACSLQLTKAVDALSSLDEEMAKEVIVQDKQVNQMQQDIQEYTIALIARRHPFAKDLRHTICGFKVSSELERIGDYASNIAKRVIKIQDGCIESAIEAVIGMTRIANQMMNQAMEALVEKSTEKAIAVWHRDKEIDRLYSKMVDTLNQEMVSAPESVEDCTLMLFMGRCCERIGDHITNIAEDVYYINTGDNAIDNIRARMLK